MDQREHNREIFLSLHQSGDTFVIPNPWDVGSALILQSLGFPALATTSAGFAFTRGLRDRGISRDTMLQHAREIVEAVSVPVSADLENGYGPSTGDVAETIRLARDAGLAGGSIEDASGGTRQPIFDLSESVARVQAAAEAGGSFVLTARAENHLYGVDDLRDTIRRLQAYGEAGADVLYAPGLPDLDAVRVVAREVDKPLNVLVAGNMLRYDVAQLRDAGAIRLSLGSTLARHVLGHLVRAASELRDSGTFSFASVLGDAQSVDRLMREPT